MFFIFFTAPYVEATLFSLAFSVTKRCWILDTPSVNIRTLFNPYKENSELKYVFRFHVMINGIIPMVVDNHQVVYLWVTWWSQTHLIDIFGSARCYRIFGELIRYNHTILATRSLLGCGPSARLWALRACLITSFTPFGRPGRTRPCDPRINAMMRFCC